MYSYDDVFNKLLSVVNSNINESEKLLNEYQDRVIDYPDCTELSFYKKRILELRTELRIYKDLKRSAEFSLAMHFPAFVL